jgi:hypothetical protein
VVAEHDTKPAPPWQLRQALLTVARRQGAEVLAVEFQEIERVKHGLGDGAAGRMKPLNRDGSML